MNSPFSKCYLAIMDRLLEQVPALRYIDQDLGQLQGYTNRPDVAFPCALIDFTGWNYENMGDLQQMAEGNVMINLGFAIHSASNNLTPEVWRKLPLDYYEIEWAIHKALQGWSPGDEFGLMMRNSTTGGNSPMKVRVRPLSYRLSFEDYSATLGYEAVPKPPPSFSTTIEGIGSENP